VPCFRCLVGGEDAVDDDDVEEESEDAEDDIDEFEATEDLSRSLESVQILDKDLISLSSSWSWPMSLFADSERAIAVFVRLLVFKDLSL
jgi:hypothetical protein